MKKILFIALSCLTITCFAQKRAMVPEDLWRFGRISEVQLSPDENNVLYGVTTYDYKNNSSNTDLWIINLKDNNTTQLTKTKEHEYNGVFHPTNNKIYFIKSVKDEGQIFSMDYDGSNVKQVSNIQGGVDGFKIAPNGKSVVYTQTVKLDETPQEVYPDLPLTKVRIFDDLMYRHWDKWHDYAYSHPFVTTFNDNGSITAGIELLEGLQFDTPMNPFGGMEQLDWSADGTKLAYTCKLLTGTEYSLSTNSDVFIYDVNTKTTTNISEFNKGYDQDPVFSPNGKYIAWKSMETPGFEADKERILLCDLETNKTIDLTEDFDQNCANYQWNKKGDKIYFISGSKGTFQIYNIDINTKKINKITEGLHDYVDYCYGETIIIGAKQSMSMPTEIFKINPKNGNETQISFVNKELLDEIQMGEVEERWIKTVDDKDMLVWVIYPPFVDKNKENPAILYCEGGPQSALSQFWSYRWNFQMMAANGYVVIAPNRRGTLTFGQEWTDQISGDYGGLNQKDYLQAVDVLSEEPFIDKDRIGAVGASYGGYSIYWLAGHHEGRFKAFISHCGIYNFYSMYGSTEENFFTNHDYEGPYWEKPEPKSYQFSPHLYVDKWDTPILIIVGANDFRIPYTQSLEAFNCARLRGVPARLLFFDNETHFVVQPQNAILWQREFKGWLDKYLK